MLKGKVKKDEEPDWDVSKELMRERCVSPSYHLFLSFP